MNKAEQIERAIEVLQSMLPEKVDYASMVLAPACYSGGEFVYEEEEPYLIELAIESLQQSLEREENKELTKDDLLQMLDEFVFVKYKNGNIFCDKIRYVDSSYSGFVHFTNIGAVFNISLFKFYKYRPKENE